MNELTHNDALIVQDSCTRHTVLSFFYYLLNKLTQNVGLNDTKMKMKMKMRRREIPTKENVINRYTRCVWADYTYARRHTCEYIQRRVYVCVC